MPVDIGPTLRQAITRLQKERQQIDHQIAALETAMSSLNEGGARSTVRPGRPAKAQKRGRKRMTAAERAAVGRRMKAYWAKRRSQAKAKK